MMRARACGVLALAAALAGCADAPKQSAPGGETASRPPASVPISQLLKRPPDYYTDDGPDGAPPVDLARVADAIPRPEPLHLTSQCRVMGECPVTEDTCPQW